MAFHAPEVRETVVGPWLGAVNAWWPSIQQSAQHHGSLALSDSPADLGFEKSAAFVQKPGYPGLASTGTLQQQQTQAQAGGRWQVAGGRLVSALLLRCMMPKDSH